MAFRLGCLFVLVPLIELALLIQVGQWLGVWPTIGIVAFTGIVGAALARREGVRAWNAVHLELATGRVPTRSLMDGAAILVGGTFLVTPGVVTDVVDFALLLPPVRALFYRWAKRRLARGLSQGTVRMGVWGMGPPPPPGAGPLGGQPGSRPDRRADREDDDEDDRPPKRGEIIQ